MRKTMLAGSVAATAALGLWCAAPYVAAQGVPALVIQGGTLIDGNGGPVVPNSVIVIQGNRIAAVGRAGQVQVPAGAQIIDAKGKWVTPGLVDAKANWNWEYGEGYLHWGVTSAMVTGARNDQGVAERDAVNHGIFPGPRLYQGVLNMQGGGPKGDKPDNYTPGDGNRTAGTVDAARKLAQSNLAGGADFVGSNNGDGPPEIFAAYADEAHKVGKGVVMRCVGPQTRGKECVLAGADVMIHTGEIGDQIAKDPDKWKDYVGLPPDAYCDMDPAKEKDMIDFLVHHDTAPEPDFMAADRGFPSSWARVQEEDVRFFDDPNLRAYYPEFAIRDVQENQEPPEKYLTKEQIDKRMCGFKNHAKFIGDLIAAGGHAVVASDDPQTPPGFGVLQEMAVFQEDAHVPPMKVLQAASSWVAHHFHIKDIGSVEVGKFADIDIVDADPTKDILNMRQMDTVIKDGKVVDRAYHPWFAGWIFANDPQHVAYGSYITGVAWEKAMKGATVRGNPNAEALFGAAAPEAKVPDPAASPPPGIEDMSVHTLIQGTPDTVVTIKGVNFVKGSVAYAGNVPLATAVDSKNQIKATVPANLLAQGGKLHISIHNPSPFANADWGGVSNQGHILVPFSFTTAWSHNQY